MAMTHNCNIKGVTINGLYIKVTGFSGNSKTITFSAGYFGPVSQETGDRGLIYSRDFGFAYDIAGSNPIAQAYAYLKTLPEFFGAVDA